VTAIVKTLRRWRVLLLLICSAVTAWVIWAFLPGREPSYHGHSLSQWAACVSTNDFPDADRFSTTQDEVREALTLLGTNNLSLLVRWIDWEHTLKTRAKRALWDVSPSWLVQIGILDSLVTEMRDYDLSLRAVEVFRVLGLRAAPAIPRLTGLVMRRDAASGRSALRALELIGEPSTPAIVFLAGCSKCPCRVDALGLLWAHTNSPAVRTVLINAKSDPNSYVRGAAIHAFNGEPSY
jgi:hypothetical protein